MTLTLNILHKRESNVIPMKGSEQSTSKTVGDQGLRKADDEKQIVWAEVYVPNVPDSQGDVAGKDEVERMAYGFMQKGITDQINIEHDGKPCGAYAVECFIARKNDPDGFIEGAWVLGVHIPNPDVWQMVKTGELNGFSFEGIGFKKNTTVLMDVPSELKGQTAMAKVDGLGDHTHDFVVHYGPSGEFLGGYTTPAEDGHYHMIRKGTATDEAVGHSHRFSFVEGITAEIVA